jgi:hypothetical protein
VGNKIDLKDRRKVTEDEGRELGKYNVKEKRRNITCTL